VNCFKFAAVILGLLATIGCAPDRGYAAEPAQLSSDQVKVLESARAAAMKYTHLLPDFICTQITHRAVTKSLDGNLGTGISGRSTLASQANSAGFSSDVIEEQLTYVGGKESYEVQTVNGKKVKNVDHLQFQGAMSEGEFGSMLVEVFDPASNTTFSWSHAGNVRGRHAWVYEFVVPKEFGTAVVLKDPDREITVSTSGEVSIDPETSEVLQINEKLDLPPNFPIRAAQRNIEFAPRDIAGKSYSLPVRSMVHMEDGTHYYDNKIEFKNYHRFASESTIHFDSQDAQPSDSHQTPGH
jgi:hypothetical protein